MRALLCNATVMHTLQVHYRYIAVAVQVYYTKTNKACRLERSQLINGHEGMQWSWKKSTDKWSRKNPLVLKEFTWQLASFKTIHQFTSFRTIALFQYHLSGEFYQDHKFLSRPFISWLLSGELGSFKTIHQLSSLKTIYQFTSFMTICQLMGVSWGYSLVKGVNQSKPIEQLETHTSELSQKCWHLSIKDGPSPLYQFSTYHFWKKIKQLVR